MCEMAHYTPQTTFWEDFSIAECYGEFMIRETFKRAFHQWCFNHIYLTELVMVLNWKIWFWYERNEPIAEVYDELFKKADQYAIETLKGECLTYFLRTVD